MEATKTITVFIGSPSDTLKERELIDEAFDELNKTLGAQNGLSFKTFRWERDVLPAIGTDPQDVINYQAKGYDFFVGIMWMKYGYETPRSDSPSVEEYENAYDDYIHHGTCKGLAMFFSTKDIPYGELNAESFSQIAKIKEFKERISTEGVFYKEYNGPDDFLKLFRATMYTLLGNTFCPKHCVKKEPIVGCISKNTTSFDKNATILFDSLSMNANVSMFKTSFIESCIFLYLDEVAEASASQIFNHLDFSLSKCDKVFYNNVLSKLNKSGRIYSNTAKPKMFSLSKELKSQISDIRVKSAEYEQQLAYNCDCICKKYNLSLDFVILRDFVLDLFDKNYDLDKTELSKGIINKENNIKRIYSELETYIKNESGLPQSYVADITKEILDVFSSNPTLYKCSTSKMLLSLFQNDQLEEYMSVTNRHLLFDTQVLLRFVCLMNDPKNISYSDSIFISCKNLWKVIHEDSRFIKHTTQGYIEEVVDHLVQARDLSRFLSLSYINSLGPSKNIFFNHFLSIRDELEKGTFEEYVSELLGIDEGDVFTSSLAKDAYEILYDTFDGLGFHIESIPHIENYDEYKKEYEKVLAYNGISSKSYTARTNDIHAIIFISGLTSSFENTPYLITLDRSFVSEREALTKRFKEMNFWYIYSPQKIANTISVMTFHINPMLIDYNIISLAETNFNVSNETISFIDLLSSFIDTSEINEWKLARKLANLRRNFLESASNFDTNSVQNVPIDELLLLLCNYYSSPAKGNFSFSEFQALMVDNTYEEDLSRLFESKLKNFKGKDDDIDSDIVQHINSLIERRMRS